MKLWMILYVGTHIGGTWGPLPYGMEECRAKAAEGNAITAEAAGRPEVIAKMNATGIQAPLEEWQFVCEERAERPQLSRPN